jgi:hypothetical protein
VTLKNQNPIDVGWLMKGIYEGKLIKEKTIFLHFFLTKIIELFFKFIFSIKFTSISFNFFLITIYTT